MPRERALTYVSDESETAERPRRRRIGRRCRPYGPSRLSAADAETRAVEILGVNDTPFARKIRELRPVIAVCGVTDRVLCAATTYYREFNTPLGFLLAHRRESVPLDVAEALAATCDPALAVLFRPDVFTPANARRLLGRIEETHGAHAHFTRVMWRAWADVYAEIPTAPGSSG